MDDGQFFLLYTLKRKIRSYGGRGKKGKQEKKQIVANERSAATKY